MTDSILLAQAKSHIVNLIRTSKAVPNFNEARFELEILHGAHIFKTYSK